MDLVSNETDSKPDLDESQSVLKSILKPKKYGSQNKLDPKKPKNIDKLSNEESLIQSICDTHSVRT